jgi:hypothetical protein
MQMESDPLAKLLPQGARCSHRGPISRQRNWSTTMFEANRRIFLQSFAAGAGCLPPLNHSQPAATDTLQVMTFPLRQTI